MENETILGGGYTCSVCGHDNRLIPKDMDDKKYSINDFLNMIEEYKDKELPNCNKPYHYEAEIASGLESLINYIKNKQD